MAGALLTVDPCAAEAVSSVDEFQLTFGEEPSHRGLLIRVLLSPPAHEESSFNKDKFAMRVRGKRGYNRVVDVPHLLFIILVD